MTDHDAALRLDTALDSGRFDDAAFDPLFTAAATLQHLDDRGHATPSDAFRTQLRQTLFASPNGVHAMTAADLPVALTLPRPAPRTVVAPKKSHRFLAVAAVLILLIGGMGAVTRLPIGSPRDPEPSAIPAAFAASPADPDRAAQVASDATGQLQSPEIHPLVVANDTVYLFRENEQFAGLSAERTSDRKLHWQVEGAADGQLAVDGDAAYVSFDTNDARAAWVEAYSAEDGSALWNWTAGGAVTGLTVSDGTLYVIATDGTLTALETETGEPRWSTSLDDGSSFDVMKWSPQAVQVAGEFVVAVSPGGTFAVVNVADGSVSWRIDHRSPVVTRFTVTSNAVVVFEAQALADPATALPEAGTPLPLGRASTVWQVTSYDLALGRSFGSWGVVELGANPLGIGDVVAIPGLALDGSAMNFGLFGLSTRGGAMTALDIPDSIAGKRITQLGTWTPPDGAPTQFVVVTEDGMLALVNPKHVGLANDSAAPDPYDGATVDLGQPAISAPVGDENGLWVLLADGTLTEIDPMRLDRSLQEQMATEAAAAGELVVAWTLDPPEIGAEPQTITEIPSDGSLYRLVSVNGADGAAQWVQAIDPATGTVRWEQRFLNGAFQMAVQADTVFMVTMHRSRSAYNVVALDAATGQQRWQAELAGSQDLTGSPVLAATESHLLVLTANGQLEAFDLHTGVIDFSRSLVDEQTIANSPLRTIDLIDPSRMAIDGQTLAVTVGDGSIMGVDLETGFVIWRVVPDGIGATAVYAIDGRFVALAHRGYAAAAPIDLPTRTPRATPLTQDDCTRSIVTTTGDMATPVPGDAATQMEILGIDRDSGDVVWRAWADEDVEGPAWALPYPDQLHLVVTPSQSWPTDGSAAIVCALDPATGAVTFAGDNRSLVTQTGTVHSTVDDTYAEIRFSPVGSGFLFPLAADTAPPSAIQIDVSFDDIDRISSLEGIVCLTLSDGRFLALLRED